MGGIAAKDNSARLLLLIAASAAIMCHIIS